MKFCPHVQGRTQGHTYATVKEHIVQQIQKTYKGGFDIAQSLKDLKKFDIKSEEPHRNISAETKPEVAAIEQTGLDIKYQEQLRRYLDRKDSLEDGLKKAYSLIYTTYCTKIMQTRIEEHPDFETKIDNDPIALLEAIKTLVK